jgi:uncharacterized protein YbaR (Trm112 family)
LSEPRALATASAESLSRRSREGQRDAANGPVTMDPALAAVLSCPYCRGPFSPSHRSGAEPWIMTCHCSRFPVIAGIPILKKDAWTSDHIVRPIERGSHFDAFVAAMMPPAGPPSPGTSSPFGFPIAQRIVNRWMSIQHRRQDRRWHEHARRFPAGVSDRDRHSAFDMFDFYLRQPPASRPTAFDYFAYRFGQPRHLVALSFTTLIERPQRPLLEIACGSSQP